MDLYEAIRKLCEEKARLEAIIAELEQRTGSEAAQPAAPKPRRRGRRSMGREERLQVSERMRKYWAARRKKKPEK